MTVDRAILLQIVMVTIFSVTRLEDYCRCRGVIDGIIVVDSGIEATTHLHRSEGGIRAGLLMIGVADSGY